MEEKLMRSLIDEELLACLLYTSAVEFLSICPPPMITISSMLSTIEGSAPKR